MFELKLDNGVMQYHSFIKEQINDFIALSEALNSALIKLMDYTPLKTIQLRAVINDACHYKDSLHQQEIEQETMDPSTNFFNIEIATPSDISNEIVNLFLGIITSDSIRNKLNNSKDITSFIDQFNNSIWGNINKKYFHSLEQLSTEKLENIFAGIIKAASLFFKEIGKLDFSKFTIEMFKINTFEELDIERFSQSNPVLGKDTVFDALDRREFRRFNTFPIVLTNRGDELVLEPALQTLKILYPNLDNFWNEYFDEKNRGSQSAWPPSAWDTLLSNIFPALKNYIDKSNDPKQIMYPCKEEQALKTLFYAYNPENDRTDHFDDGY